MLYQIAEAKPILERWRGMSTRDSQYAHSSVLLGAEAHSSALPMPSPASSLSPLLGSFRLWYPPILDHYQE